MFQFPPFALLRSDWPSASRVAPFGNHRINTCLQFPGAYRSLPRPSSPPEAKASTVRSCNLLSVFSFDMNHKNFLCCFTLVLIYSLPLKLQSTTITIDSLSFYSLQTNLISSFNFTSLSFLKLVNELRALRCANR